MKRIIFAFINMAIFIAAAVLVLSHRCSSQSSNQTLITPAKEYKSYTQQIMATPITVQLPAEYNQETANIVFDIFTDIDAGMSEWKPTSPLAEVNQSAGIQPVKIPPQLTQLLNRSLEIGNLTNGAFDITWAALWSVWDFKAEIPTLPDPEIINQKLKLIDYGKIQIDTQNHTAYLPQKGMTIGLGGIAKGYALDQAAKSLHDNNIHNFLISAGGQMMLSGLNPHNLNWRIGIRDPRGSNPEDYFAYLELTNTSVSTSGDYEKYFILDGVRYHHILNPQTGYPATGNGSYLRSATVVCKDATLADALSTTLIILGADKAKQLLLTLSDVQAVLVDDNANVFVTNNLKTHYTLKHLPTP